MEVLFEFGEVRRVIRLAGGGEGGSISSIEKEVKKWVDADVTLCFSSSHNNDKSFYCLQRWSKKWNCFVVIDNYQDIMDGDRLTMLKKSRPKDNEVEELGKKASSLCGKMRAPNQASAKLLSNLFPSSTSVSSRKRSSTFDPTEECVATAHKKKKKAAIRYKPNKIIVIFMPSIEKGVPRGKCRRKLKSDGNEKTIEKRRNMSAIEVKNCILKEFDIGDYKILCSTQDGQLRVATNQQPTGDYVIDNICKRKFPLYICKPSEKDIEVQPRSSSPIETIELSSDDEIQRCQVGPATSINDCAQEIGNTISLSEPSSSVFEFRQIRAEQDFEYAESLRIDQQKATESSAERTVTDAQRLAEREKANILQGVRHHLQSKYEGHSSDKRDVVISFWLPDGNKLNHSFMSSSCTQNLYEYVFLHGNLDEPFSILQTHPNREVPLSCTTCISSLQLGSATVLIVVEKDDSPDLLSFLLIEMESGNHFKDGQLQESVESSPVFLLTTADQERDKFAKEHFTIMGTCHSVRRSHLYDDVLKIFSDEKIMSEYPLYIKFEDERAVDFGGVSRDMFSGFWEEVYRKVFDGCSLLTPVIHPQVDIHMFPLIGRIISHGYLASGFIPVRIAFPTLACVLLGPNVTIPDDILVDTFPDCLSEYESNVVRQCLGCKSNFDQTLLNQLVGVLSKFGCREIPNHLNLKQILIQVARYEFITKPLAAISMINTGISDVHALFWTNKSVKELRNLYLSLTATSAKVIELMEGNYSNENEERVFGYLQRYVGGMTQDKIRRFLRFTTGSSVCLANKISVTFNSLCGFSRRPISHTCDCVLELPSSYITYLDLVHEFDEVLAQLEVSWTMDAL